MGIFPVCHFLGLKYVGGMEVDQTGVGEQIPICLCSQVEISMAIPANKEILYFLTESCLLVPGCLTSTRLETKTGLHFHPLCLQLVYVDPFPLLKKKAWYTHKESVSFKGYAPVPNISRYTCHRICPML